MTYGHYQRSKPYLRVLRGYDPNEPRTRTRSAPIKDGVTILSGQVICLEWDSSSGQHVWNVADRAVAEHLAGTPHFALQDGLDKDVVSSGLLTGLSCSGQFELQTGYYSTAGAPALSEGIPVTYGTGANVGKVETCAFGDGATKPVIGVLSGNMHAGPISLAGVCSEASNTNMVQLQTQYVAVNAA